jgi:acetylornithine deacetylase
MSAVVTLLERLIAARSHNPDGDEPALAALLAEELRARHPDEVALVEVPRPHARGAYVLARWGTPRLVVNAHLDTVPVNAGWSSDPFTARSDGGRLFGLGAADTKGAIAAILTALEERRPRDLLVLFSGDEEHTGTCMRAFLRSPAAHGLRRAIVCEPTRLAVGTRHRGILSLETRLTGRGGHSSGADSMPSPLADLARLAVAYADWGRARRTLGPPGFPGMCLNVAKLDGGVAFNVVPESATLTISLRPPPGADMAALRRELEALAAQVAPGAQVTAPVDNSPFQTRDLEAFVPLVPAARRPVDLAFWTEAAVLAATGVDAVVFGPGDIAQAHAPDEWVEVSQLEAAERAFVRAFAVEDGHGAR